MRRDIEFKTESGVTLRGWRYPAKGVEGPAPTIVMAHGFTATREIFLDSFAEAFSEAGFGAIVYDHPTFGVSGGEPRSHADPWAQINGYRDAITWPRRSPRSIRTGSASGFRAIPAAMSWSSRPLIDA